MNKLLCACNLKNFCSKVFLKMSRDYSCVKFLVVATLYVAFPCVRQAPKISVIYMLVASPAYTLRKKSKTISSGFVQDIKSRTYSAHLRSTCSLHDYKKNGNGDNM